jgi:hypothetical protein
MNKLKLTAHFVYAPIHTEKQTQIPREVTPKRSFHLGYCIEIVKTWPETLKMRDERIASIRKQLAEGS